MPKRRRVLTFEDQRLCDQFTMAALQGLLASNRRFPSWEEVTHEAHMIALETMKNRRDLFFPEEDTAQRRITKSKQRRGRISKNGAARAA